MDQKAFWVGLHAVPQVGARTFMQLVEYFGSPEEVWRASEAQLHLVPGLKVQVIQSLVSFRAAKSIERLWDQVILRKISVITLKDPEYPLSLKRIYDPPPVMYVRGSLPLEEPAVAIVGSRRATPYGKQVAERLAGELAASGLCIVSGLARGIDSSAHKGALRVGGRTVAVLGCGMDVIYPPENRDLMEEIGNSGAVVTEFPLGTPPEAGNFPARNRLISGLTWGTIVVEAAAKSGALITVDFALEQGRDVFAVPGPITSPCSEGTNQLLKQGAKLVTSAQDVLEEYRMANLFGASTASASQGTEGLTPEEKRVLELLQSIPLHVDTVVREARFPAQQVHAALMYLEVKGLVRQLPGKYFVAAAR
ncbi:hypothetical protein SY88_06415 [Clostridiales bacterium PH28_bin88]|nr:hypothetical protein SY88_06415 [Clostridiales bacterium PH28_bin88]